MTNPDAGTLPLQAPSSEAARQGGHLPPVRGTIAAGFRVVSLSTLLSRLLGLVRDMALASLFGAGPVLDAFTLAFRLPNLARQLFGEGALTAAFLPIFVRELRSADPGAAPRMASAIFFSLGAVLAAVVLVAEAGLIAALLLAELSADVRLLLSLLAILTPYLLFICLAAQVSAVLHSLRQFVWPALLPVAFNLVWLLGIGVAAVLHTSSTRRIQAMSAWVLAGGASQLGIAVWAMHRQGIRLGSGWCAAWPRVREVAAAMLPIVAGFAVSQLNAMVDSLIAWAAANTTLGRLLPVPIDPGTATALYFAQRMYQFPLGVFGIALGTVLFPLLASHAQAGMLEELRRDLSHGLRLTIAVGLPASAGLVVLSGPITDLLFRRGAFDESDALLTSKMVAIYGSAVWAYIAVLIAYRGFYAVGDRIMPVRIGVWTVAFNIALNLLLVWLVGGTGLAIGSAVSVSLQAMAASAALQSRTGRLEWLAIARTAAKTLLATGTMVLACLATLDWLPPASSLGPKLLAVAVPMAAGIGVYLLASRLLRLGEPWELAGVLVTGRRV